ncbi:MAG: carboxypeptidase regulatory-like domain-containing protein [Myxococcota bacterium]
MIWWLIQSAHAGQIGGTVSHLDAPLNNVRILAIDSRLDGYEVYSDSDGNFQFENLPDGPYRIVAIPSEDSSAVARVYPNAKDICDGEIRYAEDNPNAIDFNLPLGARLTGQLTYSDGRPVVNAPIVAEPVEEQGAAGAVPRLGLTRSDGSFEILGLENAQPSSLWRCIFEHETLPTQFLGRSYLEEEAISFDVHQQNSIDVGSHNVLEGVQISGQVSGLTSPIGITQVHVYSGSQVKTVQSNVSGFYSVAGLPPGEAIAWASPEGHATTYSPADDRPITFANVPNEGDILDDLHIQAPIAQQLNVILEDYEDGQPIVGASVMLYNDTKTVGKGAPVNEQGLAEFDQLHSGLYSIQFFAENDGYSNGTHVDDDGHEILTDVLPEQETPTITLMLSTTAQVSGVITDDHGTPVYGADVYATKGDETKRATSSRTGAYTLHGLETGDWSLSVQFSPYCSSDISYVTTYFQNTPNPNNIGKYTITTAEAETLDWTLPLDLDWDAMGDAWEERHGLDTAFDDSGEDPDGDGISNLEEYWYNTDPMESNAVKGACGCQQGQAANLLVFLLPILGFRRK